LNVVSYKNRIYNMTLTDFKTFDWAIIVNNVSSSIYNNPPPGAPTQCRNHIGN